MKETEPSMNNNTNPYPVYGSEPESQVYVTEDSVKSDPSNMLRHFYWEAGVSLETIG
jgi:hypothetical protein